MERWNLLVAVLVCFAFPAEAQEGALTADERQARLNELCTNVTSAPEPGIWAEYVANTPDGPATIRMALLEGDGSGSNLLMELAVTDAQDRRVVFQMDVPEYPFNANDARRIVMQGPGQPPFILPASMRSMMGNPMEDPMECLKNCRAATYLGEELLEAGGRSMRTHRIHPVDAPTTNVWVSPEVPFGIVQAEEGGHRMTLKDHGRDAVSSLTGPPQEMPGLPPMPGPR